MDFLVASCLAFRLVEFPLVQVYDEIIITRYSYFLFIFTVKTFVNCKNMLHVITNACVYAWNSLISIFFKSKLYHLNIMKKS